NTNFFDDKEKWVAKADKIVFTGTIDEFYEYQFGKLDYRTVKFDEEIIEKTNYPGCAVVNYTDEVTPYTRIIEHKHFEMFGQDVDRCPITII
ncbi:UNVERIFIED_CONTAM: UDP-galactopyranose mutase, partial [Prevotella sp. 15_C9]